MNIIGVATKYGKAAWTFTKTTGVTVAKAVKANKSSIATITGIICTTASMPATAIASFKAKEKLDAAKKELNRREKEAWDADESHDTPYEERELTLKEKVKIAGPNYILPAALNLGGNTGVIMGKVWDNKKMAEDAAKIGELTAACLQAKELVDKTIPDSIKEVVGEEKAAEIDKKIEEKKLESNIQPGMDMDVFVTGLGNDLFWCKEFGFYYYASVDALRTAWLEAEKWCLKHGTDFTFYDFLEEIKIPADRIPAAASRYVFSSPDKYGESYRESEIQLKFYGGDTLKNGRKAAIVQDFDMDISEFIVTNNM